MEQSQSFGGQTQSQGMPAAQGWQEAPPLEAAAENVGSDGALESGADHSAPPPAGARAAAPDPLHHAADAPPPGTSGTADTADTAGAGTGLTATSTSTAATAAAAAAAREEERRSRIAELAYQIAEEQHFAPGREQANWFEAERRLGLAHGAGNNAGHTASEAF